MGFRFQKRIKIAPGVRLNINKSGVSTSLGRRGASVTVGKRVVRANVGIPGTGISYSEQLTSKRPRRSATRTAPVTKPAFSAKAKEVEAYTSYIDMLLSIHVETVQPVDWESIFQEYLDELAEYGSNAEVARRKLEKFQPTWFDRLCRREEAKRRALSEELNKAAEQDRIVLSEKRAMSEQASLVLAGDESAWLEALLAHHAFDTIEQFGNTVHAQFRNSELAVYVELGDEEVVPAEVLSLTAKGNLSRKKMGKTNYYSLYQDYVCSCILGAGRNVLAILPAEQVLIHVYDRSQADEPPVKGCIVSVRIRREELSGVLFELQDSSRTIETFEHHMNHLKTKGFRLVEELE
ncbi:DUF4236 domain-containing protein [Sporosarcina aquimarina]|uniref:DUF4236 domain-containing protein n=1 Tax=Sporosarcina aquimarina TaxID=114975 RepID=UPI00203CF2DD|nr:DUF4236 domain-containing protein [Sporosarcina aquimarina]MCM3758515.1 DUF4236 domain-containing protein [Sporosarcina aquimarina]